MVTQAQSDDVLQNEYPQEETGENAEQHYDRGDEVGVFENCWIDPEDDAGNHQEKWHDYDKDEEEYFHDWAVVQFVVGLVVR